VSALTGATFSADAGQAATDTNNVKTCSYGQEGVDVTVLASRAPDEATAKKDEDDAKADLQKNAPGLPIKVDDLPGFAPGADAVVVSLSMGGSASTYSGIAIYVLKGTDFFAITDISTLGFGGPTSAQMQDLAKVALGDLVDAAGDLGERRGQGVRPHRQVGTGSVRGQLPVAREQPEQQEADGVDREADQQHDQPPR